MTKRVVWIVCFVAALAAFGSVAYRMALVTHFDSNKWKAAEEPGDFLDRRAMMSDVERMFTTGKLSSRDSIEKTLGQAERTADDDPNTWYYNLGGEQSSAAPDSITWLEVKFDNTGRLIGHHVMQELIVPDIATTPPK